MGQGFRISVPGHRLRCELTGLARPGQAPSRQLQLQPRLERLMAVDRRVKSRHALCFASLFCHQDRPDQTGLPDCQTARFFMANFMLRALAAKLCAHFIVGKESSSSRREKQAKGLLQLRLELKCAYKFVIACCCCCCLQPDLCARATRRMSDKSACTA